MVENQPHSYLVTGCAGSIASQVIRRLLDRGDHVVGIDNMNDFYDVALKEYRVTQLVSPNFRFQQLDIENRQSLARLFDQNQFSAVINLAARAGVRYSMVNPHVYMTTNLMGSLNLLDEMQKHDVNKFVLASTSSLYAGQPTPFVESRSVATPISPYAASKMAAESIAFTYHHLYGIDVSVCRYFTVYGPADRPDMCVFRFIKWIDEGLPIVLYGDGTQSRDFTFVDDIAAGTIAALKPVGYEIFNLGGGNQPVTLLELIGIIENLLNKKAVIDHQPFHRADMRTTRADIGKAREILDWQPRVSLRDGLEKCVQWFVDHKPWSAQIELP